MADDNAMRRQLHMYVFRITPTGRLIIDVFYIFEVVFPFRSVDNLVILGAVHDPPLTARCLSCPAELYVAIRGR